jgi:hypothetical protein
MYLNNQKAEKLNLLFIHLFVVYLTKMSVVQLYEAKW